MDFYFAIIAFGLVFSLCMNCLFLYKLEKNSKTSFQERFNLIQKNDGLLFEVKRLELEINRLANAPLPEKKVLSIEAQQILHDMTAHGNAVVRIIPLNPNEIFYRSPQG